MNEVFEFVLSLGESDLAMMILFLAFFALIAVIAGRSHNPFHNEYHYDRSMFIDED